MAHEPPSPAASSVLLPMPTQRARRGSTASNLSVQSRLDKDSLAQVLDQIHTTASRSDSLTTFHDYYGAAPRSGSKELVSSGVSGLFDRVKRGWAGTPTKKETIRPKSSESKDSLSSISQHTHEQLSSIPAVVSANQKRHNLETGSSSSNLNLGTPSTQPGSASNTSELDPKSTQQPDTRLVGDQRSKNAGDHKQALPTTERQSIDDHVPVSGLPISTFPAEELGRTRHNAGEDTARRQSVALALARVLSNQDEQSLTHKLQQGEINNIVNNDRVRGDSDPLRKFSSPSLTASGGVPNNDRSSTLGADETAKSGPQARPPLIQIGASHLPGYEPSRTSSAVGSIDTTSTVSVQGEPQKPHVEFAPNLNREFQRRKTGHQVSSATLGQSHVVPQHLKRRVISKDFWMKDENAKDCFSCGQNFSTFRRKHHCRTCGQIFDAKCTVLVPGQPFGLVGSLRLCKPCENMVFMSDDDSSVFSEDDEFTTTPIVRQTLIEDDEQSGVERPPTGIATPPVGIGIQVSRRNREAKQRSNILEFNGTRMLTRPSSSHSLISLARRPRSSSHRRHHSRQQPVRVKGISVEDRVPFHPGSAEDRYKRSPVVTFPNDHFVDPELAPFASDEGSDDDNQSSIIRPMGDLHDPSPSDKERGFPSTSLSAFKSSRSRVGTMSSSRSHRDEESTRPYSKQSSRLSRTRNTSFGSLSLNRPSPWRNKSHNALKFSSEVDFADGQVNTPDGASSDDCLRLVRSSNLFNLDACSSEFTQPSFDHIRRLLAQLLTDNKIERPGQWEKALLPVLLQCTNDVEPNVQLGDDMDIRDYIKIKKVPGGRPCDTGYVSGVVFSKNIALKSMARVVRNPRIAIVTFAIEYARQQAQFLSLEPVIAQEQEYLRNLVGRISALRPHVLLVQRNVSGLALDLLEKAGIVVAYNIKESVLAAVARVTQATTIRSVDKLAMGRSHLGQCESFAVKTYMFERRRKTYIFMSGCPSDLGCTVVLRGADTHTLRKIKRITEFMCYVAYNLKLETSLMRDENIWASSYDEDKPVALNLTSRPHQERINPNYTHGESAGNPDPLSRPDTEEFSHYEKMEETVRARILSVSPFVVFMQPYMLTQLRESEKRLTTYKELRDQYAAADEEGDVEKDQDKNDQFSMVKPEMVHTPASKDQPKVLREYLHAVHEAQFEKTLYTYETQRRVFDSFVSGSGSPFDPHQHQTIVLLHSIVSMINSAPCLGPEIIYLGFYAGYNHTETNFEEDCTLGQYVEDSCLSANNACKDCGKKMLDHHKQYVHGYGQVSISVQSQSARLRGQQKIILMWATCRICKEETPVTPMSDNTWRYSFAKYLELCFWSTPLSPKTGGCQHDIHKDFLRCFGFDDMVMKVQYDPVDIYNVVVPRAIVTWKVESDLKMKNEQFLRFTSRLTAFTESIKKRLDSINVDTLDEKQAAEAQEVLAELRSRAESDHSDLLRKLQEQYSSSRYYEVIPLNLALRLMDQKALEWDDLFSEFERDYFPSETDIRKLASLQLRNMFLESQPLPSVTPSDVSDAEDNAITPLPISSKALRQRLIESTPHSVKAHDVLETTVEEHRLAIANDGQPHPIHTCVNDADEELPGGKPTNPAGNHEEAVGREEVRHLDLAVSIASPDNNQFAQSLGLPGRSNSPRRGDNIDGEPDVESCATQIKPLGSGLLERIEQIRSIGNLEPEHGMPESRIPRLADLKKQDASYRPDAPPLLRAKSQPNHIPRSSIESLADIQENPTVEHHTRIEERPLEKRLADRLGVGRLTSKVVKVAPSLIPRSISGRHDDANNSVSALAKHFEQMSREFEKERLKERRQRDLRSRQARANLLASSQPVVEVYHNATDAVGDRHLDRHKHEPKQRDEKSEAIAGDQAAEPSRLEDSEELQPSQATDGSSSEELSRSEHKQTDPQPNTQAEPSTIETPSVQNPVDIPSGTSSSRQLPSDLSTLEDSSDLSIPEHRKNVWFKYLADFWSKRSASGWASLEYPLRSTEHIFEDSEIIVREDEPSSVIALSLACDDYQTKLKQFRSHPKMTNKQARPSRTAYTEVSPEEDVHQNAIEASLLSDTGTHMKYLFSHGPVKASCKIFYAESFDALRRKCGISDRFVESLSRCLKYDSKGGKTKSLFLKTLDNRFIVKSLQEVELKAFTKFAPDYFAFMGHTLFHGVPSVIAKMFGLFQVTIKNPTTGMEFSYYLLVMENLFYEQNPTRRFDLKGSMRNRKIESTGQPDEVLLDENLVETIYESPLFVREHARKLLQASVWNDTMWLCKQNVMDYSLMAGFDDDRKELIVGIIDCIRTYTWDKKLESWIKDRGKNRPTITSPKDYRNRFRVSMMQYMLIAPTVWHHFQAQMAAPKTLKEKEDEFCLPEAERDDRTDRRDVSGQ